MHKPRLLHLKNHLKFLKLEVIKRKNQPETTARQTVSSVYPSSLIRSQTNTNRTAIRTGKYIHGKKKPNPERSLNSHRRQEIKTVLAETTTDQLLISFTPYRLMKLLLKSTGNNFAVAIYMLIAENNRCLSQKDT